MTLFLAYRTRRALQAWQAASDRLSAYLASEVPYDSEHADRLWLKRAKALRRYTRLIEKRNGPYEPNMKMKRSRLIYNAVMLAIIVGGVWRWWDEPLKGIAFVISMFIVAAVGATVIYIIDKPEDES